MLLADQPAYLQPRIRHITSIRIHRLTVEYDDEDAAAAQRAHVGSSSLADISGSPGRNTSTIEGYDLAFPQKSALHKSAESKACRTKVPEQVSTPVLEDGQEPIDRVIDHIVAEEGTSLGGVDSDAVSVNADILRVSSLDR